MQPVKQTANQHVAIGNSDPDSAPDELLELLLHHNFNAIMAKVAKNKDEGSSGRQRRGTSPSVQSSVESLVDD